LNKALIDTDIFSEMTKGVDQTVAANARSYRKAFGYYTISVFTFMEIIRGYQKKQASRQMQAFLAGIASEEVIPFDQAAAELAGKIAGDLERVGRPIGLTDPMIASTPIQHGLELVTGNTTHFQYVQQLGYPLTLVNWR
jgi:predicted nucleic acid-binding protein